jgi:hypothetical protein
MNSTIESRANAGAVTATTGSEPTANPLATEKVQNNFREETMPEVR